MRPPERDLSQLTPLTSFVGRETELADLTALLEQPGTRLVTLTGPGGMGKTRLAMQAAERMGGAVDRVAVVALATIRDPAQVVAEVAQGLGMPDVPVHPEIGRLQAFLGDAPILLVLDNAEHLLDAVAALVARLLASCSRLLVLCTSRTPLRISGEQVMPLAALDARSARTLFTVRAQAADPAFTRSTDNEPVIDAICARLDGLPLAIELAAARIPVLPPPALLARLDQRLDLLSDGPRDAAPRHRDLHATIAWSYDLLPEAAQELFRRLGVFVGGFTLEAAQAVAGDDRDALRGMSALVSASLVIPVGGVGDEPRYAMLETIRDHALARLDASEEEYAARLALVRHIVTLARRHWAASTGRESENWLRRLVHEQGNIRTALAWTLDHAPVEAARLAGDLADYWIFNAGVAEGRDWAERALGAAPGLPVPIRARVLLTAGWMAKEQEDLIAADAYLTEAAADARTAGDDRALVSALGLLVELVAERGDVQRIGDIQAEMQAISTALDEPLATAIALVNLGRVATCMGNLAEAQGFLEQAVAAHQVSGGRLGVAIAQDFLGGVLLDRGDESGAAMQFCDAIHGYAAIPAWGQVGIALAGFGVALVSHAPETSARVLGAAAVIFERTDVYRSQGDQASDAQAMERLRSVLGDAAFEAAWTIGRKLAWVEVLAEVDAAATLVALAASPAGGGAPSHGLTPRELEVLILLAEGRSNRGIATALSVSERTVENHVLHILTKLKLESRTAAAIWAVRNGMG